MSSVNFDVVSEKAPELRETANIMRVWFSAHGETRFLDPGTLAKSLGSRVTIDKLVRVLAQLVAAGQVDVRYGVALPDGTFAEGFFDNPAAVPRVVFDSSFQPVNVEDKYIVPVYLPHST
jgi:hypothetical protein